VEHVVLVRDGRDRARSGRTVPRHDRRIHAHLQQGTTRSLARTLAKFDHIIVTSTKDGLSNCPQQRQLTLMHASGKYAGGSWVNVHRPMTHMTCPKN